MEYRGKAVGLSGDVLGVEDEFKQLSYSGDRELPVTPTGQQPDGAQGVDASLKKGDVEKDGGPLPPGCGMLRAAAVADCATSATSASDLRWRTFGG